MKIKVVGNETGRVFIIKPGDNLHASVPVMANQVLKDLSEPGTGGSHL